MSCLPWRYWKGAGPKEESPGSLLFHSSHDPTLIFCHDYPPLNQPFLPLCIRWPKYWSFSLSIRPSNEYSGLISLRTDRFDLLAVQGTFRSLDQHHGSKASILWHPAFCWLQLSHAYGTPGKTIALTVGTFVCRVPSLLFSTLPRRLHWCS